jgi:hypothetical protein
MACLCAEAARHKMHNAVSHSVCTQTLSGAHSALCPVGIWDTYPGYEAGDSSPSRIEVKNMSHGTLFHSPIRLHGMVIN